MTSDTRDGPQMNWRQCGIGTSCRLRLGHDGPHVFNAAIPAEPQPPIDAALERWATARKRVYVHWQGTYATANNADEVALDEFQEAERVLRVLVFGDQSGVERASTPAATEPQPPIDADIRDIWRTLSGADIRAMLAMWQARQGAATEPADGLELCPECVGTGYVRHSGDMHFRVAPSAEPPEMET